MVRLVMGRCAVCRASGVGVVLQSRVRAVVEEEKYYS